MFASFAGLRGAHTFFVKFKKRLLKERNEKMHLELIQSCSDDY